MSLIKNIHAQFGDFLIAIPEWKVADEGITVLSGPSGAGKTTLFRILVGLEQCPSMQWWFGEENIASLQPRQKRLGVVFQDYALFPHMTAFENIIFPADKRSHAREQTQELIAQLKLQSCQKTLAANLSGGEKQRVALARAIMCEPRILLLDEPFAALDIDLRVEARNLVKAVIAQKKLPAVLVTHDPEDIKVLADQVVTMTNGRIVV